MNNDLMKALVNAINLSAYYSDSISTNFTMKDGQIVCSFDGNPDVDSYIQEVGNEMIELFIGNKKLTRELFDSQSLLFSSDGAERVYDEDGRVSALKFNVTPEVEGNCKLLFAMAFMDFIGNEIKRRFEENPKANENQIKTVHAFVQSITVGRIGKPINDLYSISLDGIKSANPLMNKALRNVYVATLKTQLENCGVDSSEFFELNDNVLSIKDITSVGIVNNIAEHTAGCIALHFARQDNKNSKVKNITDVFRREVFQLTTVNGKNGILIDGYDSDVFTDEVAIDAGNDFALILKIEVSDTEVRDITREEADRINAAFRKKGFGNILIDVRGKTEKTQSSKSKEPVYGIPNKQQFALLIPYLMKKSPIVYNELSKCFEHGVNLGNLYKSREHSDLKNDLYRILLPKFYKGGYLDKKGLAEANSYISSCILDSGFGLNGYNKPELVEFVDKKIKELLSANRAIPQATNNTLQVPSDPMSSSTHSNDSGCGTDSPSGSPKRQQPKVMLPRPVALNIMAASRSAPGPQQDSQSGQKTVQHADETCSAKLPASSSQQETSTKLKLTRPVQPAQEGCSIS